MPSKRIFAISRLQMVRELSTSNALHKTAIISINEPGERSPVPAAQNVLILNFEDLDSPIDGREDEHILFDTIMAAQVLAFLRTFADRDLVVHCQAGISRSAAVAIFAHELFGTNARQFRSDNPNIDPNLLVLRLLRDAAGIPHRKLRKPPPIDPANIF